MKVTCIIPAAGKGKRLGLKEQKPFVMLGGRPLVLRTLKIIEACKFINDIIVVVSRRNAARCRKLVKKYKIGKVSSVVTGGKKRFDSVKNGLAKAGKADIILIHDGARPLINPDIIKKVFLAANRYGAALCATRPKETLKITGKNLFIQKTPNRKTLWEAQTPQGFKKDLIVKAYKKAKTKNATDDSSLVERLGHKVKIIKGSYGNIKITTPEDLALARLLIGNKHT